MRAKGNAQVTPIGRDEPCQVERCVPIANPTVSDRRIRAGVEFGDRVETILAHDSRGQ